MPLPRPAPGTAHWWVIGVVGCLAAVAVIVWWGVVTTVGGVTPEVTGYRVDSDTAVTVEYDLHRPAGVAVVCRINALDSGRNRVGTVEDSVPAQGPAALITAPALIAPAEVWTPVTRAPVRRIPVTTTLVCTTAPRSRASRSSWPVISMGCTWASWG